MDLVVGFTGGFKIKREYWSLEANTRPFRDMHFQLTGSIVAHLSETFVTDWRLPPVSRCVMSDGFRSRLPERC